MRCPACGRLPGEGHCHQCHAVASQLPDNADHLTMRRRRKELGLTAMDLARLIGASDNSVYAWESGRTRPTRAHKMAWRKALGL